MDWPRARGFLLLTFTLVNGILAYALWRPAASQAVAELGLASFQVREVRSQLAAQGFALEAPLPRTRQVLPFLRLAPPSTETRQTLFSLFDRMKETLPGAREWMGLGSPVWIRSDGAVVFDVEPFWGAPVRLEREGAVRQIAEAFLRESGLRNLTDLRLARIYPTDHSRRVVEYVPVYEGLPVFAGYVEIVVGEEGVEQATAFLPSAEGLRGEPKRVLAPTEALLRLVGHLKATGRDRNGTTFTSVELGYFAPRPLSASVWDTNASWRILTASGDVYYVNAFTGEVEGP